MWWWWQRSCVQGRVESRGLAIADAIFWTVFCGVSLSETGGGGGGLTFSGKSKGSALEISLARTR